MSNIRLVHEIDLGSGWSIHLSYRHPNPYVRVDLFAADEDATHRTANMSLDEFAQFAGFVKDMKGISI